MFYEFKNKQPNPFVPEVTDVTPQEVYEQASELYLVDVREDQEYTGELGHVAETRHVKLATIPEQLTTFPKDKTIVFICRSGGRSAQASMFAIQEGYTKVYNMQGGMILWNQLQLPIQS
jgi:rhodanese-related sulfurtransferase